MVLTPRFSVTQDAEFIILTLKVPYLKASSLDFEMGGNEFKFCVHPYFLRLHFSHEIIENGKQKASYNSDEGELVIYLPKAQPGQEFQNLDMLTTLLSPVSQGTGRKIEEVGAHSVAPPAGVNVTLGTAAPAAIDLPYEEKLLERLIGGENVPLSEINNSLPLALAEALKPTEYYGFNSAFTGYFRGVAESLPEIMELPDPDVTPLPQRRVLRLQSEELKFDPEHYMGDFVMDEEIRNAISWKPNWSQEKAQVELLFQQDQNAARQLLQTVVKFEAEESDILLQLKNKNYIIEDEDTLFLSLIDILFGYAYEARVTTGEFTVESSWSISRLSATLSWFDRFRTLPEVAVTCFRRALCYPLYRHWGLAGEAWKDVCTIFLLGKRAILRALIQTKRVFDKGDVRRHLSILYIDDYCVWIQSVKDEEIQKWAQALQKVTIRKEETGWPLAQLETEANENREEIMNVDEDPD